MMVKPNIEYQDLFAGFSGIQIEQREVAGDYIGTKLYYRIVGNKF